MGICNRPKDATLQATNALVTGVLSIFKRVNEYSHYPLFFFFPLSLTEANLAIFCTEVSHSGADAAGGPRSC